MGLYLGQEKQVYLEITDEDENWKLRPAKVNCSIFVDESVENNPEFKEKLLALYKTLAQYKRPIYSIKPSSRKQVSRCMMVLLSPPILAAISLKRSGMK